MDTAYTPPFTISPRAINLIAEISAQIERYAIRLEASDGLRLRKANRIKTIHSSLAIEGNKLSESEVTDILEGKTIVAPLREIQEVKNAIKTYELYPTLNPFKVKDLLRAHATMMASLIDEAGRFRSGGVGVFSEGRLIHLAPPAMRVPLLINDLFAWLKQSKDHLLIRSCVFHYEFEFIHPFADGNGRMGRLWQSLILGQLSPIFEHLPVENMVFSNQQQYYHAITESGHRVDCSPFIDFMLEEILKALLAHQGEAQPSVPNKIPNKVPNKLRAQHPEVSEKSWTLWGLVKANPRLTADEAGIALQVSGRMARKYFSELRDAGLIRRIGPTKGGHWEVVK